MNERTDHAALAPGAGLDGTRVCATHQAYRSEHLAIVAAARHPAWSCQKCRGGSTWHVFRCPHGRHHHVGHLRWWDAQQKARAAV